MNSIRTPMKLYTDSNLINRVAEQGKSIQMYWDDFKLYGKSNWTK